MAKCHPIFSFPRRWRRSQRCWEYPSKHRRDRCKRRALLDYFKCGCFYHHISQPNTPPFMFDFVFILHLMFFQQTTGIYIQMLSKAGSLPYSTGELRKALLGCLPIRGSRQIQSLPRPLTPGPVVASKAHFLHGRGAIPNAPDLCLDIAANPADPVR